jgi:hypothetical protein
MFVRGVAQLSVLGMKQRLLGQAQHVVVLRQVKNVGTIPAGLYESRKTQLGEVLRHGFGFGSHVLGKVVDGVFAMQECPNDA